MLHEPIQQQLGRLGLRGAADMLARLPLNDEVIDALALLLEAECLHRDSLAQSRRMKLAKLGQRAHPADVDLRNPRGLGKTRWQQMLSLNWLKQHQHLLLTGPTGIGKSYLACALAKAAIDAKQSVRYLRLPRLGEELATLQAQGRISHWLKTLARIDLVILDDFGLVPMSPSYQPLLLELLEDRHQRGSVLVTSQLPTKLWRLLQNPRKDHADGAPSAARWSMRAHHSGCGRVFGGVVVGNRRFFRSAGTGRPTRTCAH